MWVILLEALGAGLLLVFIVWWTMFQGRAGGERPAEPDAGPGSKLSTHKPANPRPGERPPGD